MFDPLNTGHGDAVRGAPRAPNLIRVIEAVTAGGVSYSGAIFRSGRDVKGLTTGAGMWPAGAIGACGAGYGIVAVMATVLGMAILARCNGWRGEQNAAQGKACTIAAAGDRWARTAVIASGAKSAATACSARCLRLPGPPLPPPPPLPSCYARG
ncbi:MAG TPA: MgtC/SapB family protein [Hyphomicrobium sp.]|nr:MgtC/SapB family protein [Hyphomicrobium sp.]